MTGYYVKIVFFLFNKLFVLLRLLNPIMVGPYDTKHQLMKIHLSVNIDSVKFEKKNTIFSIKFCDFYSFRKSKDSTDFALGFSPHFPVFFWRVL